jgi:hypothetical protein
MTPQTPDEPGREGEDPALTGDIYAELFDKPHGTPIRHGEKKAKVQPHSAFKKRCRDALAKWSGARGVLIPIQNIKVEIGKGANRKSFMTGRVGCGDDIYLIDRLAVSLEYKMSWDSQRETQAVFQKRWEAAGGLYLIVRSPEQKIAGIEAALKGRT